MKVVYGSTHRNTFRDYVKINKEEKGVILTTCFREVTMSLTKITSFPQDILYSVLEMKDYSMVWSPLYGVRQWCYLFFYKTKFYFYGLALTNGIMLS